MQAMCKEHATHSHTHGSRCGHTVVTHDGHTDYLHDGHLHHIHEDHVDEHSLSVGNLNPSICTPDHNCKGHDQGHTHGPACGGGRSASCTSHDTSWACGRIRVWWSAPECGSGMGIGGGQQPLGSGSPFVTLGEKNEPAPG